MFTTALFDMDGVLINSRSVMLLAWEAACLENNCDVSFELFIEHVGKPFDDILHCLSIPSEQHQDFKRMYSFVAATNMSKVTTYKNIHRVLRVLRFSGLKIGIVTSKEFARAEQIVDKLLLNCNLLVTPEYTENGKPSPDPILYALNHLKSIPSESFYVGDMASDLKAASEANVFFIKACWGYGNFKYNGPCLDTPNDLLDFLNLS